MWKTASPLQWGIFKRKQICSSCKRFLMKCFIISVTRSATLLMCCITLSYKLVILSCTVDAAGDERVSESQKTESVWGVAKWSSRVYRQLSEVRHFNLLLFWKCAATLFFLQLNDINMVAVLGLIPFSSPRSHLSPPKSRTLNEVCYYSSSATVRRHLNATPRTSIQAALSSPHYYLQVHPSNIIKCVTVLTWGETETTF